MENRTSRVDSRRAFFPKVATPLLGSASATLLRASLLALFLLITIFPLLALAQFSATNGWVIQLTGMVQVEPSSNVVELEVKETKIRFAVHDLYSTDRNFSAQQFFSELRRTASRMRVRSTEDLQDLLLKEKPSKRVLKLIGRYYPDSRLFLLDRIDSLPNKPPPEF
ncbi:MAG: hypothetical protein HYZ50_22715 [Deltaproteobacteria bacterium]|nr:hypothetical protein [Deltaproteobacteria bacterium]